MKVGIVGSRTYENKRKIKDFILLLKKEFGNDLEIVSGGCKDGGDRYAKEFALEMNIKYVEFPPYHQPWNAHCPNEPYMYNKPYNVRYFFIRNKQIADYSDVVVGFIPKGHTSNGTKSTLDFAEKQNKPTQIIW